MIDLPLRVVFSAAHPLADIFHPPYPPIASQSISRDVPLTPARALKFSPLCPREGQPDRPSLHASREHIPIVRPRRARRMVWLLPSHPSEAARCTSTGDHLVCPLMLLPLFPSPFQTKIASGEVVVHCACRTSTVSSCAFHEQEGRLTAPYLPIPASFSLFCFPSPSRAGRYYLCA
jgi:hypothetical protein